MFLENPLTFGNYIEFPAIPAWGIGKILWKFCDKIIIILSAKIRDTSSAKNKNDTSSGKSGKFTEVLLEILSNAHTKYAAVEFRACTSVQICLIQKMAKKMYIKRDQRVSQQLPSIYQKWMKNVFLRTLHFSLKFAILQRHIAIFTEK